MDDLKFTTAGQYMSTLSETYKYEDGWRMMSKHAFGTTMFNEATGDVIITSDRHIYHHIPSKTVEGGTIKCE